MRLGPQGEIILSKRNLLALLSKLTIEGSKRTLRKNLGDLAGPQVVTVMSENDEDHYRQTELPIPGPVSALSEKFIMDWEDKC